MKPGHSLAVVAMLSCFLPAQTVQFTTSSPKAGAEYRSTFSSQLVLYGEDGGTVNTHKVKDVKVLATSEQGVTQVKVQYIKNHKTSSVSDVEGSRSVTEGRSYVVHKTGEVTLPSGMEASRDEVREVARDMKVGQPNPAASLAGKSLVVGATVAPELVRALLEDNLSDTGIDEVEDVAVSLASVTDVGGVSVANFTIRFGASIRKGFRAKVSIRLEGKLSIVAASCSMVGLELEGPVKIVEKKGIHPLRRRLTETETNGKLSLSMKITAPAAAPARGTGSEPNVTGSDPSSAPLIGKWRTQNPGEVVEIRSVDGKLVGEVVESPSAEVKPGLRVIESIRKNGEAWDCTVYAPKRDMRLEGKITIVSDGIEIEVRAGPTTKKSKWTRM